MSSESDTTIDDIAARVDRLERENQKLKAKIDQRRRDAADAVRSVGPRARQLVDSVASGSIGRREAITALLASGAIVVSATGTARAAESANGAACSWRGDQQANGYSLFGLRSLEGAITGEKELTDIAGTNLSIDSDGVLNAPGLAASSDLLDVLEGGTEQVADASDLDFDGSQFDVTNPSGSEAAVALATTFSDTLTLDGSPSLIANNSVQVAKGKAIEDGDGTERFSIRAGGTEIKDENGDRFIRARSASDVTLFARSGQPIKFSDLEGGFEAAQYITSASSPGTLELTNADLKTANTVEIAEGGLLRVRETPEPNSPGGAQGPNAFVFVDDADGNLKAKFDNGTTVTIATR